MADIDGNQEQLMRYAQDLHELVDQHTRLAQRYKRLLATLRKDRTSLNGMRNMAMHDHLTGLPNRYLLDERMGTALATRDAADSCGGLFLLYLDLDGFKPINDQYGHQVGDQVLVSIGQRIQSQVRACDTVARLGGDEFAVLLQNMKSRDVVQRIVHEITHAVAQPLDICGQRIVVGVSVGTAEHGLDGADLAALLRVADASMYSKKRERLQASDDPTNQKGR